MRAVILTVAFAYLVIPPLMADPAPAPAPSEARQFALVPPTPTEAFRAPPKDKDSVSLNVFEKVSDSDGR
jgi:hypothetical protein